MRTTLENILLAYAFDSMWNDDHAGDTESPTGYFARFIVENEADSVRILDDYRKDAYDDDDRDITATDLVGTWYVWQDSNGSVNYAHRSLTDDGRGDIDQLWNQSVTEYTAWLDADESEV